MELETLPLERSESHENQQSIQVKKIYKKHQPLVYDGRHYRHKETNANGTIRVTCSRKGCKGRLTVLLKDNKVAVVEDSATEHNPAVCYFDPALAGKSELIKLFLNTLGSTKTTEKPVQMFNRLRNDFRTADIGGLTFKDIKRKAQRIKSKNYPERPKTLKHFGELLQTEKGKAMLKYDDGRDGSTMSAKVITVAEKSWPKNFKLPMENKKNDSMLPKPTSTVIIIADKKFVQSVLENQEFSVHIYNDGTFSITMSEVAACQTYIMQAASHNHAWPINYILMERRTTESYEAVFDYVFNELAPELKNLQVLAHMDYEVAVLNAMKIFHSDLSLITCAFHYMQAHTKQAKKKGALVDFKKNTDESEEIENRKKEIAHVLRLVQLLPYLPPDKIDTQLLQSLQKNISNESRDRLKNYMNYVEKSWINNKTYPPKVWSIYKQTNATNNFSESRNKDMTLYFGRHPYPWQFIEKLAIYQGKVTRDYEGRFVKTNCTFDKARSKYIRSCEEKLEAGRLNRLEFLESIAAWKNENITIDYGFEVMSDADLTDDDENKDEDKDKYDDKNENEDQDKDDDGDKNVVDNKDKNLAQDENKDKTLVTSRCQIRRQTRSMTKSSKQNEESLQSPAKKKKKYA